MAASDEHYSIYIEVLKKQILRKNCIENYSIKPIRFQRFTLHQCIFMSFYRQLVTPLQQSQDPPFVLTERHLQILWLEQKFFLPLFTPEGEAIKVISPGIWNNEAGPDFLKAHIKIGDYLYRGDVEIHLHQGGWCQHKHHEDPRYNQVILHLVFWNSAKSTVPYKENGQSFFVCHLQNSLSLPPHRIVNLIDIDLYPSKKFSGNGRCANLLFQNLTEESMAVLFRSAAYWRLERKLNFFESHINDRSIQFAAGIAMALGYKNNAVPFFDLFLYLFSFRDLSYDQLLAIAYGCCGFLEDGYNKGWEASDYYQLLRSYWWERRSEITHQTNLKLDRIRPIQHPVRRLAYLVQLLQNPTLELIWNQVLMIWNQPVPNHRKGYMKLKNTLLSLIPAFHHPYWERHYNFEKHQKEKALPTLGEELKTHIFLNTYLPLLFGSNSHPTQEKEWKKIEGVYNCMKCPETSKSQYLHHRFFGDRLGTHFQRNSQMVQGAYQLHHDFCLHFEASCEGCPFVERYLESPFVTR
jgi:hypothetical protein